MAFRPEFKGTLASEASDFLSLHDTGVEIHRVGREDFNGDGPLAVVYVECNSVVAPICRFILEAIDRHDIGGEELRQVIPIGLCANQKCGEFFVPERARRKLFCSGRCRARKNGTSMTKEQKAAKMRDYRLRKKERELREIRVARKG